MVNVAARLQAECPPGGICVSRPVRDHVHDRLDLAFEELGALNLKNIARPVEAFVLRPPAQQMSDGANSWSGFYASSYGADTTVLACRTAIPKSRRQIR